MTMIFSPPMKHLFLFLLALIPQLAGASCANHPFTPPARIALKGDSVLIVTHASAFFDARYASKRGIDEAVEFAKARGIPVVYLHDDGPNQLYFMEDCQPDYWVYSEGGELSFDVRPSHVYIVGGHLEKCLSTTVHDILYSWAKQPGRDLTLTYLMDGIYSNGKLIDESDPYYPAFDKFMSIVAYGRPGGEHWPKLNMLETMGIIKHQAHELEYLKKVLPHYERTLPEDYRVELQVNDSTAKVLRASSQWLSPTLRFHFVDSALNLAEVRFDP